MIFFGCEITKKAAVVDAPAESLALIEKMVRQHGFQLEALLLTHSHWDHIAETAAIQEKFKIPIYVHPDDVGNLKQPGSDGLPLYFSITGTQPDHLLHDGQLLQIGNLEVRVITTPGHTPGGVCFWLPQEKLLFSGDTLFKGAIGNLSFTTAEPDKMWESLRKLGKLPPETRVIPGHGPATTIGAEKKLLQS